MKNRAHESTFSRMSEEFDVANLGTGGERDHVMHIKDGETHEPVCCKFGCGRCGQKGHDCQDCALEVELYHRCHQPGHITTNWPCLMNRVAQTPSLVVCLVAESGPQDLVGMYRIRILHTLIIYVYDRILLF